MPFKRQKTYDQKQKEIYKDWQKRKKESKGPRQTLKNIVSRHAHRKPNNNHSNSGKQMK